MDATATRRFIAFSTSSEEGRQGNEVFTFWFFRASNLCKLNKQHWRQRNCLNSFVNSGLPGLND